MSKVFLGSIILWSLSLPAGAMDLQEFLSQVLAKNNLVQALDVNVEQVEDRRLIGDLELAPNLSLAANFSDDKKMPSQYVMFGGTETKTTTYSASLGKLFSSGTNLSFSATAAEIENPGLVVPAGYLPPGVSLSRFGTGTMGVNLSQSLWKNFFGKSTRLRWERENEVALASRQQLELQKRQVLLAAETAFWDAIFARQELNLRQESLARAKKIESWTQRRFKDGISDEVDLLQTKALVAQREQQLLAAEDSLRASQQSIWDFLERSSAGSSNRSEIPLKADLAGARNPRALLGIENLPKESHVQHLESYIASLNAKAAAVASVEAEDHDHPDLVLTGGYNTNAYQPTIGSAVSHLSETSEPTMTVGIKLTYLFDSGPKSAVVAAARKEALAQNLLSSRKKLESESAWLELERKYSELGRQIQAATNLSDLQTRRAKAQSHKFSQGRSVTTDVVNAEQDAAEAELSLTKLQSEQRKLEARSRLFVVIKD